MKEEIEKMTKYLTQLTKDEADLIECVLKWPDHYKAAFLLAKSFFEEEFEK
jgi:hypothetical protein